MERVEEWHTENFKTIFDDSEIQDKMSWKIFKFDRSIGWLAYGAPTERPHIKGQNDSSRWLIWAKNVAHLGKERGIKTTANYNMFIICL